MLCTACLDGYARGENFVCSKCTVSRDDALWIILGSVFALVMVIVFAVVVAKRASRAPLLERLFIRAMEKAAHRHGIYGAVALLFGSAKGSDTGGDGMSYAMFIDALRPGGSLSLNVPGGVLDKEAKALWDKLDEDDGKGEQ